MDHTSRKWTNGKARITLFEKPLGWYHIKLLANDKTVAEFQSSDKQGSIETYEYFVSLNSASPDKLEAVV